MLSVHLSFHCSYFKTDRGKRCLLFKVTHHIKIVSNDCEMTWKQILSSTGFQNVGSTRVSSHSKIELANESEPKRCRLNAPMRELPSSIIRCCSKVFKFCFRGIRDKPKVKEVQIVYRLFQVNCMETYRVKQKQIETEVFTIYLEGLEIHWSK